MRSIAVQLACLSGIGQAHRVYFIEGRAQANSQEWHDLSEKASAAVSRNVSLVASKQSLSDSRVGTASPLKALAMLLLALNSTAGWQASGHGGRYIVNNPNAMSLGLPPSLEVGSTMLLNPQDTLHRDMPSRGIMLNADPRHADTRMAVKERPMWEFEDTLFRLAPLKELPKLRKMVRELESLITDAMNERNFTTAAGLRADLQELCTKDPAVLSSTLHMRMQAAIKANSFKEAAKYRDQLSYLKRWLPEYNLAGMWKGSLPGQEDMFVRLRYDGDTLTAAKLDLRSDSLFTGEVTDEVVFKADVSESHKFGNHTITYRSNDGDLDVDHFVGEGMAAGGNFVPGQMYLMEDDIIGFLWLVRGGNDGGERGGGIEQFVAFQRLDGESTPGEHLTVTYK